MPEQVNVYDAKTRLSQLIDRAMAGEEVVIARNGHPVARLMPLQRTPRRREPGSLRGKIHIAADFDEVPADIVDAMDAPIEPGTV